MIYLEFIEYFENQWIIYFERGDLNLNYIDIKLRTNNCLENYNNKFNKNFKKKGKQETFIFLDAIMNEVINHEKILNELRVKSFKDLSEKKLNLKDKNIGVTINQNNLNNKEIDEIINSLEKEIKIS